MNSVILIFTFILTIIRVNAQLEKCPAELLLDSLVHLSICNYFLTLNALEHFHLLKEVDLDPGAQKCFFELN